VVNQAWEFERLVRMKKVRDLQAPPLQLLLWMNSWRQQLTSTGPGFRERPLTATAWAGQWMASPRRVGSGRGTYSAAVVAGQA